MSKFFKWLGIIILSLLILVVAAFIVLVNVVNPNQLKPIISKQVYKATGRKLTLSGNLSWTIFPTLGVKLNNAQLSNAPGFNGKPFIAIKNASISVKLLPLLSGDIETNDLILNGLTINLRKNRVGQTNWTFVKPKTGMTTTTAAVSKTQSKSYHKIDLTIPKIEINHATLTWQDKQTGQKANLNKINLKISDIKLNKPFPIALSFEANSNKPKMQSRAKFTGNLTLKNMNSRSVNLLQNIILRGDVSIQNLHLNQFKITQINSPINIKNAIIKVAPITANIYQGRFTGLANINMKSKAPIIAIQGNLKNTALEPLIKDLTGHGHFKGTLNIKTNLHARSFDQLVNTLNGEVQFSVKDGAFVGVDFVHLIQSGEAIVKKQAPPAEHSANQTNFGSLTGTAHIQNGIATCNDLLITYKKAYKITGQGTANLVTQRIDYDLEANLTGGAALGAPIPISVSGPFQDISTNVNIIKLTKNIVTHQLGKRKDQLKNAVEKGVEKLTDQLFR